MTPQKQNLKRILAEKRIKELELFKLRIDYMREIVGESVYLQHLYVKINRIIADLEAYRVQPSRPNRKRSQGRSR